MDANYVMDETLGTASFEISKLNVGQTKTEVFLIGKVRKLICPTFIIYRHYVISNHVRGSSKNIKNSI